LVRILTFRSAAHVDAADIRLTERPLTAAGLINPTGTVLPWVAARFVTPLRRGRHQFPSAITTIARVPGLDTRFARAVPAGAAAWVAALTPVQPGPSFSADNAWGQRLRTPRRLRMPLPHRGWV